MIQRFRRGRRWVDPAGWFSAAILVVLSWPGTLRAEPQRHSTSGDKVIVESGAASRVEEKVRLGAPGTLVAMFVEVGDAVQKGQLLGHTELEASKFQLDLARHALENLAPLKAAEGQAEAAVATRAETEEAVRKRTAAETRLDWAIGMEKFHRSNYEAKLEQKKLERIQFDYWTRQYEARFLRAPVDGVVTEVAAEMGRPLGHSAHVFTIGNDECYMIPVSLPAELAGNVTKSTRLPVRATSNGHVARGVVNEVSDDPSSPGKKLIRLLLNLHDFPPQMASNLAGMKFDVLFPQDGQDMNS
ncbi:MAG TPA: HlyD family efflux transporter periplasmic adaptor subunit [Luteolibacter sp.]|nr:HlyD family efflux transporter periplasmic adaptor subunit [Luteolibacter sp.]